MANMIENVKEGIGTTFFVVMGVLWALSAPLGAIYWAVKGDLLNVVLSILIPLYGSISVVAQLFHH